MAEIEALRTPDTAFKALPEWPYAPRYLEDLPGFSGLRMHYIDVGPAHADVTFLCIHGNPSWSYIFRKMIPVFIQAGHRVVAPDMFGFGRSDKPASEETHNYHFHRESLKAFLDHMRLKNTCLVCQDWGGILGLTLPMDYEADFTGLLVMNTGLPVGGPLSEGFAAWQKYSNSQPDLPIGALFQRGNSAMTDAEANAFDAPFPDPSFKAAIRRFPDMVMTKPGMHGIETSKRALSFWSEKWSGQSFMAVGAQDPVLNEAVMADLRHNIRGCPEPMIVEEAGHFVQEWGGPIAKAALEAFGLS